MKSNTYNDANEKVWLKHQHSNGIPSSYETNSDCVKERSQRNIPKN